MQGPTVDSLPISPGAQGENLVLTAPVGAYAAGAYQWVNNRWQFLIDYATICREIFTVSQAFVVLTNTGDNVLPIGDSGAAILTIYRNGVVLASSAYYNSSSGIVLNTPAGRFDVYVVLQNSPLMPTTPISGGGGGISDAPVDGNPYVRKNAAWENIQNELTEGVYTGH